MDGKSKKNIFSYQPLVKQKVQPLFNAFGFLDLREAFTVFDKNSDGFISKQELSEAMENFGHMISNSELEEMINLVDKDGKHNSYF